MHNTPAYAVLAKQIKQAPVVRLDHDDIIKFALAAVMLHADEYGWDSVMQSRIAIIKVTRGMLRPALRETDDAEFYPEHAVLGLRDAKRAVDAVFAELGLG